MTLETSQILNSCLDQQNLRQQSWYCTNDCKRPKTLKWLDDERHPHLLRQFLKDVEPQERLSLEQPYQPGRSKLHGTVTAAFLGSVLNMSAAKRGPNWTNEEDESLCEAWLNCSQDSIVGIQQKSDTLYERVCETFVEICNQKGLGNNPGLRAPSGIKARWHVISKACSKFAGNLAQVINRQRSGATPQDNINEALILYKKDTNHSFTHMTSFRILQNAPKWIIYESNLKDKTSSGTKRKLVEDTDTVENDDCVPSTSSQISRPLGVKSSKTILENRSNLSKSSMELAAAAKQVARAAAAKSKLTKEKIAAINRLADTTIMTTDTANLSDTARRYIEIQQKLILEKLQSDASGGDFDAGDGEDNDEDEVVSDKGVEFLDSEED
ncbi:conserved hypothetical protein [Culex quinquefasciatus]|uniref:No apical meristem-associated C-terminal domain-containing protein n=1 Tax=Culex quinquefasciatus TaxID=7176 RepID=B0X7S9_CULQU|nr:conserved hypothetical protein [Culex quinquefasciatus]|eukprot:XP_001865701.1 conserved hypothetical protein [Culex quinquefasciatus]